MAGKTKEQLALISKGTQFTSDNQPGNPGRKKKLPELDELLAELLGTNGGEVEKSEAKEVFKALIKKAKAGDVPAAVAVLNRAYGMPKTTNEHTGKGGKDLIPSPLSNLAPERQAEYLRMLISDNAANP